MDHNDVKGYIVLSFWTFVLPIIYFVLGFLTCLGYFAYLRNWRCFLDHTCEDPTTIKELPKEGREVTVMNNSGKVIENCRWVETKDKKAIVWIDINVNIVSGVVYWRYQ